MDSTIWKKKKPTKKTNNKKTKPTDRTEWIYKIFRDANNMSGKKLFTISNETEELGGSQYKNQREVLRAKKKKKEHSFQKTA